jgi:hypothetical protein
LGLDFFDFNFDGVDFAVALPVGFELVEVVVMVVWVGSALSDR